MNLPTYSAHYKNSDGTTEPIYVGQARGNLIGQLPYGSFPVTDHPATTLERSDGGDPFEYAHFMTSPGARRIVLSRDKQELPLEIVLAHDPVNGTFKVMSNCRNLPLTVLNVSNPDPDDTDAAEAKLAASRLHMIYEEYGN